jgi:hypothetical protein
MTEDRAQTSSRVISHALQQVAESVTLLAPSRWDATLRNGVVLKASVRLDEGWLLVNVPTAARADDDEQDPWDLLKRNAQLPGLLKHTTHPRSSAVHLRAEVPWNERELEQADQILRIRSMCEGIQVASAALAGHVVQEKARPKPAAAAFHRHTELDLPALCVAAGWSEHHARENGSVTVNLDVGRGVFSATLARRSDGCVHAWADLAEAEPAGLSVQQREAVGRFLLVVGGQIRMARPTVEVSDERVAARLEVVLTPPGPSAAEIAHALAALAVGCGIAGKEAMLLFEDQALAEEFLNARGRSPGLCRDENVS